MSIKLTPDMLPFVGKTRRGHKAVVVHYDELIGFYGNIKGDTFTTSWQDNGRRCDEGEYGEDIVSEWKEPVRHKAWVVMFWRIGAGCNTKDCCTYFNKKDAERMYDEFKRSPNIYIVIGIAETNEITEEV